MSVTNKPKLSSHQLVQKLKSKGVEFNIINEQDAANYLLEKNNYLRTASYRKNYPKNIKGDNQGKYIHLEFAYLAEISTIDMYLRDHLLHMCIDIEHDLKVRFLKEIENNSKEDGYAIVKKFLTKNPQVLENICQKANSTFTDDLISKYFNIYQIVDRHTHSLKNKIISFHCPVWVLIEIIGFGDFLKLYFLYCEQYQMIPIVPRQIINPVKCLRNACAHNNCLFNDLSKTSETRPPQEISNYISSIIVSRKQRKHLTSRPLMEISCLLYCYPKIVSPLVYQNRVKALKDFANSRLIKHYDYFNQNLLVKSSIDFLKKIIDNMP